MGEDDDGPMPPLEWGRMLGNPDRILQSELWSRDEDTGAEVGFICVHDLAKGIFYAKLTQRHSRALDEDTQRVTKGAISTLLDVSEASRSRKISLGLDPTLAGKHELICSLLYLGFQVVPPRKYPLDGVALILDLELGLQGPEVSQSDNQGTATDNTYTGTSDCSTNDCEDSAREQCVSEPDTD